MCSKQVEKKVNYIKSRDDKNIIEFFQSDDGEGYLLEEGSVCSWAKKDEHFTSDILRQRIEPWLTALFQSEHLSLLVGSGLTHAISALSGCSNSQDMSTIEFSVFEPQINNAAETSAKALDRGEGNLEDQIRIANELLVGLTHYSSIPESEENRELRKKIEQLKFEITNNLFNFAISILENEKSIITALNVDLAFNYLIDFLMSPASRSGTRDRLHIFTTNYDRLIEAGADIAGLHLLDRFVGSLSPIFRSSRLDIDMHYNPPGIRGEPRYLEGVVHYTKLHGSVDWVDTNDGIRKIGLPFGSSDLESFINAPGIKNSDLLNLMIYPNSAKDSETAVYPYVELFRDFAASICRPNHTLITYGYGFGDEHINRVIEDMLIIPSTHLVIISYDDPLGRILKKFNRNARKAQITILIGDQLGDLRYLNDYYLPKPAIDRTTFKMAELLNARYSLKQNDEKGKKESEEK